MRPPPSQRSGALQESGGARGGVAGLLGVARVPVGRHQPDPGPHARGLRWAMLGYGVQVRVWLDSAGLLSGAPGGVDDAAEGLSSSSLGRV